MTDEEQIEQQDERKDTIRDLDVPEGQAEGVRGGGSKHQHGHGGHGNGGGPQGGRPRRMGPRVERKGVAMNLKKKPQRTEQTGEKDLRVLDVPDEGAKDVKGGSYSFGVSQMGTASVVAKPPAPDKAFEIKDFS